LDGVSCFWRYEGLVKKLISEAKYEYYYDQLKQLAIDSWQLANRPEFALLRKFLELGPVVVPVPLHNKRMRERGFNQAELVGQQVGKLAGLKLEKLLIKVKETEQQVGKNRKERLENLKNAFKISNYSNLPKNVLLVDDVWTTGTTLSECAKVLKQAGVKKVWGLVVAR
jgi:ComF family protein